MKKLDINNKLLNTPTIPIELINKLPLLLKECILKFNSPRERDIVTTSSLGILSGCLPKVSGEYYNMTLYTNMYMVIIGPSGSGKSNSKFAKKLADALHVARKKQERESNAPVAYKRWGHFIAADTSAAMFIEQLYENEGEATVYASEIETLYNSLSQEYGGGLSAMLRDAAQHESIRYARKGERKDIEIPEPKLALVLTGTLEQMRNLISSIENGFFSRICYYVFKLENEIFDIRPRGGGERFEHYFINKGEEVKRMASFFESHPTEFKLTESQWDAFNDYFNENRENALFSHGDDAHSPTMRIGIIMFRIAMIISALRQWERNDTSSIIFCTDDDFLIAKALSEIYMKHILTVLEMTPKSNVIEHLKTKDLFYLQLPPSFQRSQAVDVGARLGLNETDINRTLKMWTDNDKLIKPKHGHYQKPE